MGVPVCVAQADEVRVSDAVKVGTALVVDVAQGSAVSVAELVGVEHAVGDPVIHADEVPVDDVDSVPHDVAELVGVAERLKEARLVEDAVFDVDTVNDRLEVAECVEDVLLHEDTEPEGQTVGETVPLIVALVVGDVESVTVAFIETLAVKDRVCTALVVTVEDVDRLRVEIADTVTVTVRDALGKPDADGVDETLADLHREATALLVTHGVALELLATVAVRVGALELDNSSEGLAAVLADVARESLTVPDVEGDSDALEDALRESDDDVDAVNIAELDALPESD